MKFLEKIFSIKNDDCLHKVVYFMGIKCKFKRNNVSIEEKKKYWISKARKQGVKIGNNNEFIGELFSGTEPFLIEIGDNNLISFDVTFLTHDGCIHTLNNLSEDNKFLNKLGKIVIKNNCFIGCKSIILPNIVIGNNCILGAGSVLTKSIPDNEVWAGNPAKKICSTFDLLKKVKDKNQDKEFIELVEYVKKNKQ